MLNSQSKELFTQLTVAATTFMKFAKISFAKSILQYFASFSHFLCLIHFPQKKPEISLKSLQNTNENFLFLIVIFCLNQCVFKVLKMY